MSNLKAPNIEAFAEIENSHEDKTTTIVGTVIRNGCQMFKIEDLDKVVREHNVSKVHVDEMLEVFKTVSKKPKTIGKLAKHHDDDIRKAVALQGLKHDVLVGDENKYVRWAVAKTCNEQIAKYLVEDSSWEVRVAVASRGFYPDLLATDEDSDVRSEVARFRPELMINDESSSVRASVASVGYGLETLINDESHRVRRAVAEQGYGLETLANDSSVTVLIGVISQQYKLLEIEKRNLDRGVNAYEDIIIALIEHDKENVIDVSKYFDHEQDYIRSAIAKRGLNLENYITDDYWRVRMAVAQHGVGLDILIDDEDCDVRAAARYAREQLTSN